MVELSNVLLLIQVFILVIILICLIFKIFKNRYITKDEYLIHLDTLERSCVSHIELILNSKIEVMQRDHNLNPESQINSIKKFKDDLNIEISKSASEIIKSLSPTTRKTLLRYYSLNGLILYIINFIKNHIN